MWVWTPLCAIKVAIVNNKLISKCYVLAFADHPEVSDMVGVVFEIVTDDNVITCKVAFSDTAGSEAKVAEIQREHLKW